MGAALLGKNGFTQPSQDTHNELPKIKEYRTRGRTGFKVSDISYGTLSNESVINAMLQAGVNYLDTSEYYRKGNDERKFGNAIKGMDRKQMHTSHKLPLIPRKKKYSKTVSTVAASHTYSRP
jgi:aryl-alcohol dehydrogenase-like predicted oxidoreductase